MQLKKNYLFVLWEGGGNVPPILGLARQMIQRGHRVLVISDPCNEPEAKAAGCEFFSYTTAPHRYSKSADTTLLKDYAAGNTIKGFRMFLDGIACGPALNYARDVLEILNKEKVDVVVVSEAIFGGCFAAEVKNIPFLMLIPGTLTFPAPGIPPPGMHPKKGMIGKLLDKITNIIFNKLAAHGLPAFNNARKELGLIPSDNIIDYVYSQPHRVLVMTSPDFEFPAQLPPNVRITGALLDDPYLDKTEPINLPETEEKLILVGFSTTYQNQEQLIRNVIEAIGQTPYKAIVTLGPALQEKFNNLPPNIQVFSFLPHSIVLPKTAAVVTHAGHGTVIRSLAYGVPLVCIPIGRDQPANAARVHYKGAGVSLKTTAKPKEIASAIKKVVEDPIYRKNAQKLSTKIMEQKDWKMACEELEGAAIKNR